jgi:hypothetical protein
MGVFIVSSNDSYLVIDTWSGPDCGRACFSREKETHFLL